MCSNKDMRDLNSSIFTDSVIQNTKGSLSKCLSKAIFVAWGAVILLCHLAYLKILRT